MRIRSIILSVLLIGAPSALVAQQSGDSMAVATPADCAVRARIWRDQEARAARQAGRPVDVPALVEQSNKMALTCAGRFPLESLDATGLAGAAETYLFASDTLHARQAVERGLALKRLTPVERAHLLLEGIRTALETADIFDGVVPPAERMMSRLDAMSAEVDSVKLAGHMAMLGMYGYGDVDSGIRTHALAVLGLAHRTEMSLSDKVFAYTSLARVEGDLLHPDSALLILARAEEDLGADARARAEMENMAAMYRLVGTQAPPVTGDYWINAPDSQGPIRFGDGRVYLVQFTAHWCVPCRNSYPGLKQLAARFGNDGPFEQILVTDLYGNFDGKTVTPEVELAADRTYYPEHWGLPFRIAVNRPVRQGGLDAGYHVRGIPEVVIIDGRGTIRQVVIGWDGGNTRRIGDFVQQLLDASPGEERSGT